MKRIKSTEKAIITLCIAAVIFISSPAHALTLNLVSDIHSGSSKRCDNYKCVPRWEEAFQEVLDKTEGPIITAGDNTDTAQKSYVSKIKSMIGGRKVYFANGNHDKKTYVQSKHQAFNLEDYRIIIAGYSTDCHKKERAWLKNQLKNYKDKKVVVVTHVPIFNPMSGKMYGACKKQEKIYNQYNVDYVISGHWHGNNWERELHGVKYIAVTGLTYGGGTHYRTYEFK